METQTFDLKSLSDRVEKLEKQNRRLKQIGLTVIVLISAIFVSGQAKTGKVIEASAFHLVDASGRVRADLSISNLQAPTLSLSDEEENLEVVLEGSSSISGASLKLGKSQSKGHISLEAEPPGMSTALLALGQDTSPEVMLAGGRASFLMMSDATGIVNLDVGENGPRLAVTDRAGYTVTVGRSDLVTTKMGVKEQTPAASIVLSGKDKKVLWSAP